jgi:hypothetical protein
VTAVNNLVSGTATQVAVGSVGGQTMYLNLSGLVLTDQMLYSFYLNNAELVHTDTLSSYRRTAGGLPREASDPLTGFHDWFQGLVTSDIPLTIASNASQLRGAATAAIGLTVLIAAPAEVAVVAAATAGAVVWLATTLASAATTAALEGAGNDILKEQPPDISDFQYTMSIVGNAYFEAAQNGLLDTVAETTGPDGQIANQIVQTSVNIAGAVAPGNSNGVTDQTVKTVNNNLFNQVDLTGSAPAVGTIAGCPPVTGAGFSKDPSALRQCHPFEPGD